MILRATLAILVFLLQIPGQKTIMQEITELFRRMKSADEKITQLRCRFRMDITKEGRVIPQQTTVFRFRPHPLTIHLTFIQPHEGRTAVYRQEDGEWVMRARPDGFLHFMTFRLDPRGERAMEEAIDPITRQGFPNIVAAAESLLTGASAISMDTVRHSGDSAATIMIGIRRSDSSSFRMEVDSRLFVPVMVSRTEGRNAAIYRYDRLEINPVMKEDEWEP